MNKDNPADISRADGIVPAEESHLAGMVECHMVAFPGELSTLVGRRFVRRMYRYYLVRPDEGFGFVALNEAGKVCGLTMGGVPGMRSRFARRPDPILILTYLYKALVCRYVRGRFLRAVARRLRTLAGKLHLTGPMPETDQLPPDLPDGTWALWQYLCVLPDCRERGIGRSLMFAFLDECAARGYKTACLPVARDNATAIAFYERAGWRRSGAVGDLLYYQCPVQPDRGTVRPDAGGDT